MLKIFEEPKKPPINKPGKRKKREKKEKENHNAASALHGTVCFISPEQLSGLRGHLPFHCPHQQRVFSVGKEKDMREAALRVGEVTHLRLVLNPFSAADFL